MALLSVGQQQQQQEAELAVACYQLRQQQLCRQGITPGNNHACGSIQYIKEAFDRCSVVLLLLLEEQCWNGVGPLSMPDDLLFELACAVGKIDVEAAVFAQALQICKAVY
jgi:hypothetical protein